MCNNEEVNGVTRFGGYAEYVLLRTEAVVPLPKELDPAEIAPLMCAGVTVFNAMRKMHVEQGGLLAVQGLGGLGHLAVQYGRAMGYRVVAISRGADKKEFAVNQLGAHEYIDSAIEDPAKRLQEMGGAAMVCTTAPNAKAVSEILYGLAPGGVLIPLAPIGNVEFDTLFMVIKGISVHGWPSGHALDSEEAVQFARDHGVKCMVEKFPLDKAAEAFQAMVDNKLRFRAVLVMDQ
jgi:D-arabinose 1-dehydrogenase-like Zn-dependent alcohol dehydrogenase